jgi:hypothetical protein
MHSFLNASRGALAGAILVVSGCGPTTEVEVEAVGLAGARVTIVGDGFRGTWDEPLLLGTLDPAGHLTGRVPPLETDELVLLFERDGRAATVPAICLPPVVEPQPIDRARFLLRRARASGECSLIALEIEQGGSTLRGLYQPELFDDAPCGAWADGS